MPQEEECIIVGDEPVRPDVGQHRHESVQEEIISLSSDNEESDDDIVEVVTAASETIKLDCCGSALCPAQLRSRLSLAGPGMTRYRGTANSKSFVFYSTIIVTADAVSGLDTACISAGL